MSEQDDKTGPLRKRRGSINRALVNIYSLLLVMHTVTTVTTLCMLSGSDDSAYSGDSGHSGNCGGSGDMTVVHDSGGMTVVTV
jgi:hypothetical protein